MSGTKMAHLQTALTRPDELADAQTMRGIWLGLLIAMPCWFVLALLMAALS